MNNLYETGGVPPFPMYLQDRLCKCQACGSIFAAGLLESHVCKKLQYVIDYWYDRRTKSWVVQCVDSEGNQVGEARYVYTKAEARQFELGDFK